MNCANSWKKFRNIYHSAAHGFHSFIGHYKLEISKAIILFFSRLEISK